MAGVLHAAPLFFLHKYFFEKNALSNTCFLLFAFNVL